MLRAGPCVQASTAKKKKELRPSDARRMAAKMGRSTEWMLFALHVVNLLCTLLVPSAVVELTHAEPVPGFVVVVCTVILWMKLVSYAHCNYDLRLGLGNESPLHVCSCLHAHAQTWQTDRQFQNDHFEVHAFLTNCSLAIIVTCAPVVLAAQPILGIHERQGSIRKHYMENSGIRVKVQVS